VSNEQIKMHTCLAEGSLDSSADSKIGEAAAGWHLELN
jgi:hypothetical protein